MRPHPRRTLAVMVVLAAAGCTPMPGTQPSPATPPAAPASAALARVHDPGHVTGHLTGPCRTRDHGRLPDPRCTPGAIDPAVTQATIAATICRAGYTATVRPPSSETSAFKRDAAAPAYGLSPGTHGELDHLVPLELGGANDAANLWIEAGAIPNPKDSTEAALHRAVCAGRITLGAAQAAIAEDWETAGGLVTP